MKRLIALTVLVGATFVATPTLSQASATKDPSLARHTHSQVRQQPRRHAGYRSDATALLSSTVAAYVTGHFDHPIHPLTSGTVRTQ